MKKNQKKSTNNASGGFNQLPSNSDFYTGAPEEKALYQHRSSAENHRVQQTGRHKVAAGRRKATVDPREQMALLAILKMGALILFLLIAFFVLWKGIKLYEENIYIEKQPLSEVSPLLQEVALIEEFDIQNQGARDLFAERVEQWKEADRLVRSSDAFLKRNNYDHAVARCQDALRIDPSHMGALERLGELYFAKELHVEAINSYMRLLSVDPSRSDLQKKLIQSLDARGDSKAVIYLTRWYFEKNHHDSEVQRYLANALFVQEKYKDSIVEYNRVLADFPRDARALETQAKAYIYLEQYEKALDPLVKLREIEHENRTCYKLIIECHAQLGNVEETVQMLGLSAHLFGQNTVVGWIRDPLLDPVREERSFQVFADRVGGEEFRKWLEKVAKTMDGDHRKDIDPQLMKPDRSGLDAELLQQRK